MKFIFFKFSVLCLLISLSINHGFCQSDNNELIPSRKKYYVLANQNDFNNFMISLNSGKTFDGDTIELITDIMGDGMLLGNRIFSGTFLGGTHKISNLSQPFVFELKGTIDNLIIDATCHISGTSDVSSFCIKNYGEIRNCINYAQINGTDSGESYMHVGGVCSISYGKLIHCKNYGNITATLSGNEKVVVRCGGITSFQQGKDIIACENYGTIKASAYYDILCGGINADQQGGNLIGCVNHGSVSSTVTGASSSGNASSSEIGNCTGGIVGQAQVGALINRCKNFGTISNNTQYVGGIAGQVSNTDLYNLINYGRIESVQGKFYSCAAGITGYTHAINTNRDFYNCINKGNVVSFSQYGIATAAGICPDIVNCNLANLYSLGNVSAKIVGGTGTRAFEISDYEYDSQSVEQNKIDNIEQANSFVDSDNTSKTRLLSWKQTDNGYDLNEYFYAYSEPSHGCVDFYIFFDENNSLYDVNVKDIETGQQYSAQCQSPIRIALLQPNTTYDYEIRRTFDDSVENGEFTTLSPNIVISTQSIGYNNIEFKQICDARGVKNADATVYVYNDNQCIRDIALTDSIMVIDELDEETEYKIQVTYKLNGKDFKSKILNVATKAITPIFNLIYNTPYSLTLKCENFEEIRTFNPCLYVETPKYYEFGGFKIGENRTYELGEDGKVTIDSLLYDYSPILYGKYTINNEDRYRKTETFKTLDWGGEGIIQLSPNAAMVHGLFGGFGEYVPERSRDYKYNKVNFVYRDVLSSDEILGNSIEGVCIDNGVDYATTIPMNSYLYQFYIRLWCDRTYYGQYPSKVGEWQIVNAQTATVDVVEPSFFNMRFENNTFYCSCIQGEETISEKILQYKVDGMNSFNEIVLSRKSGSEALYRKMSSIVPQLTYLVRMVCKTTNEKIYYSSYYRLNNNKLEIVPDTNDQISSVEKVFEFEIQKDKGKDTYACYSIDGNQLSQPQKGLNLIKMSDGTTRKVVKY